MLHDPVAKQISPLPSRRKADRSHATVSVVLALRNGMPYLEEQLRSLFSQTRRPDEILICDDASSDGSCDCIAKFEAEYPGIIRRIRNEVPLGVDGNFGRGIALASGDVILLCDQDDVWMPDKVATFAEVLEQSTSPAGVFCDSIITDADLRPTGRTHLQQRGITPRQMELLRSGSPEQTGSVFWKRVPCAGHDMGFSAELREVLLPFPKLPNCYDTWIGLVLAALGLWRFADRPLTQFRQHGQNVSGSGRRLTVAGQLREARRSIEGDTAGWNAELYAELIRRLGDRIPAETLAQLRARRDHSAARSGMNVPFFRRLPLICCELVSGRYFRFGRGAKGLLQYLLLRRDRSFLAEEGGPIALLRLDEIGDFCLFLPYARALRKAFPRREITLIGNALWLPCAEKWLDFNRFIAVEPKRFLRDKAYRKTLCADLKKYRFSLAVNPRFSRYVLLDDRLQLACAAPRNVAWRYLPRQAYHWRIGAVQKLLNLLPGWLFVRRGDGSEAQEHQRFLDALGIAEKPDFSAPEPPAPPVAEGAYWVLLPGAGAPCKNWFPGSFAEAAKQICALTRWRCVIAGTEADLSAAETVLAANPEAQNFCGRTSVEQLASLIAGAKFVLGNDSAGVHLAALFRVPSVAVIGGGSGNFLPYRENGSGLRAPRCVSAPFCRKDCNWQCAGEKRTPRACIAAVPVEAVADAVKKELDLK